MSNLWLRDEFPQDEVSLIISESVLKTPAKTWETNVNPGLKPNSKQTFTGNLHSTFNTQDSANSTLPCPLCVYHLYVVSDVRTCVFVPLLSCCYDFYKLLAYTWGQRTLVAPPGSSRGTGESWCLTWWGRRPPTTATGLGCVLTPSEVPLRQQKGGQGGLGPLASSHWLSIPVHLQQGAGRAHHRLPQLPRSGSEPPPDTPLSPRRSAGARRQPQALRRTRKGERERWARGRRVLRDPSPQTARAHTGPLPSGWPGRAVPRLPPPGPVSSAPRRPLVARRRDRSAGRDRQGPAGTGGGGRRGPAGGSGAWLRPCRSADGAGLCAAGWARLCEKKMRNGKGFTSCSLMGLRSRGFFWLFCLFFFLMIIVSLATTSS